MKTVLTPIDLFVVSERVVDEPAVLARAKGVLVIVPVPTAF